MNRRRYLAGLAGSLGLTSGCLSQPSNTTSTPPQTSTTSSTESSPQQTTANTESTPRQTTTTSDAFAVETPPVGECTAESPPKPSTGTRLPDALSYPDEPSAFTRDEVLSFLEEYETAYRYNLLLSGFADDDDCVDRIRVTLRETKLSSAANGYTGEITTYATVYSRPCEQRSGTDSDRVTPTAVHGDYFDRTGTYRITDRFLMRNKTVVECFD